MLTALLLAWLQTVPGPITKIPRDGTQPNLCLLVGGTSDLVAGASYDLVFFVDVGLRYSHLYVALHELWGSSSGFGVPVRDTETHCTSGPNANQRPHLVPLRIVTPGIYQIEAVIFQDYLKDGVRIDQQRVTVK